MLRIKLLKFRSKNNNYKKSKNKKIKNILLSFHINLNLVYFLFVLTFLGTVSLTFFLFFFSINPLYSTYYNGNNSKKAPLIKPINGEIIVHFRQSYFDELEKTTRKHTGIDILGESNSKVIASGNGFVSYIGFSPIGGRTLVIKHNDRIRTTYLNLMQILVSVNDIVKQGDQVATIGAFDDPSSNEVHLHFGIIYDDYYLDPEDIFNMDYSNISKYLYLKNVKPDFKISYIEQ